jgi:hypothetical protein
MDLTRFCEGSRLKPTRVRDLRHLPTCLGSEGKAPAPLAINSDDHLLNSPPPITLRDARDP